MILVCLLLHMLDLNLMDWGSVNQLALALGGALYLWNPITGETQHLIQMDGEDYISSVRWIGQGNILAVGNNHGHVQVIAQVFTKVLFFS